MGDGELGRGGGGGGGGGAGVGVWGKGGARRLGGRVGEGEGRGGIGDLVEGDYDRDALVKHGK